MADFTPGSMKLGPCAVKFNGTSLGATKGGIKVNISVKTFPFKCDQAGETVVKEIELGAEVTVEMTLLELTPAMLVALAACETNGEDTVFSDEVGRDLLATGKVLLLTEIGDLTPDTVTFYKAIPDLTGINLSGTAERDATVKFNCVKIGGTQIAPITANDIFKFVWA